jgi:glycosyltransferase involved in cell wall biosynthesis
VSASPTDRGDARRLRVAFVSYDFGEYCVPLANALAAYADVRLFLPRAQAELARDRISPDVEPFLFDKPRIRQPLRQLRLCRRLLAEIHAQRPDVVHLQQGHQWFSFLLPLLGRRYPLVVTIHDHQPHYGDWTGSPRPVAQAGMNFTFRRADRLIVHAEQLKREVPAKTGVDGDVIHVIPHVAIAGAQPRSGLTDDGSTVLFFGRLRPYKGLEYLIRAEPLISAAVPEARFVIAGTGDDFARYRSMMVNPGRFTVHNTFVSAEQRADLFAQASVVALPYVEASQSGVVPVAYEYGKPVVATRVGGLPDAVDDGRTGLLVPPADERALAEAIVRLLKDARLRRRMGEDGTRKLEQEWAPHVVAAKTAAVYALAAGSRASARPDAAAAVTAGPPRRREREVVNR